MALVEGEPLPANQADKIIDEIFKTRRLALNAIRNPTILLSDKDVHLDGRCYFTGDFQPCDRGQDFKYARDFHMFFPQEVTVVDLRTWSGVVSNWMSPRK